MSGPAGGPPPFPPPVGPSGTPHVPQAAVPADPAPPDVGRTLVRVMTMQAAALLLLWALQAHFTR